MSANPVPTRTFADWWNSEDKFDADTVGKGGIRACCEKAWNAACEASARAQAPMLRSMIARGHAADLCRSLKTPDVPEGVKQQ